MIPILALKVSSGQHTYCMMPYATLYSANDMDANYLMVVTAIVTMLCLVGV